MHERLRRASRFCESAAWAGELGRTLADSIEPLLVTVAGADTLELPSAVQEELRAMGYGD